MIRITDSISIGEGEIRFRFVRAPGPGGQNVNKVASAVQLRFHAARSPSLPDDVKRRLARLAGARMTSGGAVVIEASRHRSQKANRDDAVARLVELLRRAARPPKKRIATRATAASRRRRLQAKKRRARTKRLRKELPEQ